MTCSRSGKMMNFVLETLVSLTSTTMIDYPLYSDMVCPCASKFATGGRGCITHSSRRRLEDLSLLSVAVDAGPSGSCSHATSDLTPNHVGGVRAPL